MYQSDGQERDRKERAPERGPRGHRVVILRRVYDRWRDANGIHVPVGARVEQTEVDARIGTRIIRPHLVRAIPR